MKITGKTRIFRKEFNGNMHYSTSVSNKKEDGTYENMYLTVQFKKGQETEGNIEITEGFLSFYKDKNGAPKLKIVIMEYSQTEQNDFVAVDMQEDLPF